MKNTKILIYSFIMIILSIGCKDDPVTPQEEHFEAIGTAIYDASGALVVSILRGVTNDTLKIKNGELCGLHLHDNSGESFPLWVCADKDTHVFTDAEIVQTKYN